MTIFSPERLNYKMNTSTIIDKQITSANGSDTAGQQNYDRNSVTDTSFSDKTHAEKATFLNNLNFTVTGDDSTAIDQNVQSSANGVNTSGSHLTNGATVLSPGNVGKSSEAYIEIIRAHYINDLLRAMQQVQPHACTPGAGVYINQVLHTIRNLEEKSPNDPALEILFALYDALAFDGLWTTYTADQYRIAEQIFTRVLNQPINNSKIEKAIAALSDAGFDTMPYTFSLDDEDDD